jgi:N6-adenosine-specific RNA methylase IME4
MAVEEWKAAGQTLGRIERAVMWWIGDWWAYGEHRYGDRKAIVEAPDWTGPSYQTCANAANVCRAFETSRRREVLSFKHHAEVAALPPTDADRLLVSAEPKAGKHSPSLTASELRGEVKRVRRMERITELAEDTAREGADLHRKVYNVIYIDPPWPFEVYSEQTGMDRAAANHYPTMSMPEIRDLAIPMARNCALFVWTTIPWLSEACDILRYWWDVEYKTSIIWVKDRVGTGYWVRSKHETLLLATRGEVPAPAPGMQWTDVIEAKVTEHSTKPEIFAEMIEAYFPIVPKIELFARRRRAGWDAWGNETPPSMDKEERPF